MIGQIITLLQANKWEGISENIEIAKGKNQTPTSMLNALNKIKRKWLLLRK
jgi:hypothetical protein